MLNSLVYVSLPILLSTADPESAHEEYELAWEQKKFITPKKHVTTVKTKLV